MQLSGATWRRMAPLPTGLLCLKKLASFDVVRVVACGGSIISGQTSSTAASPNKKMTSSALSTTPLEAASQLPGRTDNDVKNYWNTKLKKKLRLARQQQQQQPTITSSTPPLPQYCPPAAVDPSRTVGKTELADHNFSSGTDDAYRCCCCFLTSELPPFPMVLQSNFPPPQPAATNDHDFTNVINNGLHVSPPAEDHNWSPTPTAAAAAAGGDLFKFLEELGFGSYNEFLAWFGGFAVPFYSTSTST